MPPRSSIGCLVAGLVAGLLLGPAPALADADTGSAAGTTPPSPLAYTVETLQQTRVIIDSDSPHNQQLRELHGLLGDFLDTDWMGRAALDKHTSSFSKAQLKEFLTLFRELFQRTYVQKLLLFDRPDFEYVGEEKVQEKQDDYVRVDTLILTPRDEFSVAYKFHRKADRWQAYDIQIEDLSLTTNFRRQLDSLLAKSTVENVLGRMRRKYGSVSDGGGS